MLVEILCDKFREKKVEFDKGLNVVLGDNVATNSIGKSAMLLVIDFVYGGNTFWKRRGDVIKELGHHSYCFQLKFDTQVYYFKRTTNEPEVVYRCSASYEALEAISTREYTDFLLKKYSLENLDLSFRNVVSLFSRVWKKENLNVYRPLANYEGQAASESIEHLIKLYLKYDLLREFDENLAVKNKKKIAINNAITTNLLPSITKKKFLKNEKVISEINEELKKIADNLSLHVTNVQEVINKEVLELTEAKDALLKEKLSLNSRLKRLDNSLLEKRYVKNKEFKGLKKFFPDIDLERLEEVEAFHFGIVRVLKKELQGTRREVIGSLERVSSQIDAIDKEIMNRVTQIKNPAAIVDRIYKITKKADLLERENTCFAEKNKTDNDVKRLRKELAEKKNLLLSEIAEKINSTIVTISYEIYEEERKTPIISLKDKNYQYEIVDDTGTGTAYFNLLLLDIAVFRSTVLPFIIHDSLLFKNISNEAVGKLITIYNKQSRQSFIAIDEVEKYGQEVKEMLYENSVLKLNSKDVLYVKKWSKDS